MTSEIQGVLYLSLSLFTDLLMYVLGADET